MLNYQENENAIYIKVCPFPDVVATKEQGMKVLEEASECREAYDYLAQASIIQQDNEDEFSEEEMEFMAQKFFQEACDCIQAAVNLIYACVQDTEQVQNIVTIEMNNVYNKNYERGYYGEQEFEDNGDDSDDGAEA